MKQFIGRLKRFTGVRRQLLAFFAGAVMSFALAPFYLFFLCFLGFSILIWLIDGIHQNQEQGFKKYMLLALTGWSFGFGYFVFGLWWMSTAMLVDFTTYYWAVPFALFGLPAYLAIYYGGATLLASFIAWHGYGRIVALSLAFGLAEWLRGVAFTGFPWNSIGYTAMPTVATMQIASLIGVFGVNFFAVLVYATPAVCADKKLPKLAILLAGLFVAVDLGFGMYRLSFAPDNSVNKNNIHVRLVQPSTDQSTKLDQFMARENFDQLVRLSIMPNAQSAKKPDLIIWPETALPYYLDSAIAIRAELGSILQDQQLLLLGSVRRDVDNKGKQRFYNSMQVIDKNGEAIAFADKVHLVPFGEYLPFSQFLQQFGLSAIADTVGGYSAAAMHHTIRLFDDFTILPLICYEAIFANEMAYSGEKPNVIVNITNDAWFGNTPGPWQHFQQARLRAVEQNMTLIRATNNGVSAVVDPYGRIIGQLEQNKITFLDVAIPNYKATNWSTISNSKGILSIILCLLIFIGFLMRYQKLRSIDII